MALSFDAPVNDGDFMPSLDEIEEFRQKLKRYEERPGSPTRLRRSFRYKEEYDNLGRNISEQHRRQENVPWVKVRYDHRGRLFISNDKKEKLRELNLLN